MSAPAESTSASATRVSSATVAVLKLLRRKYAVSVQDISSLLCRWPTSGTSAVCLTRLDTLLGLPTKKLDAVIYYEKYIVINPGVAEGMKDENGEDLNGSHKLDLLTEDEYMNLVDNRIPESNDHLDDSDPKKFIAKMGAEAIYDLLKDLDLDRLAGELRDRATTDSSQMRKTEALKRLQVVEAFRQSKGVNRPEWMIMKIIPVIPPELRPLVPLDGGRFATSDLNDLYRRVIIRNNRLKRLMEIKAPEVILRNEKRMLQEAVDSLFDNSRKATAVKSESNRPLKSLSDSLKGKQGRFRQNLLGKRVDYSARSVIVVGPELNMGECGLPKLMAAELYKPFIIRKLIERGIVKTVKSAKKIVDRREPVIWDILENVMKGHPVLLNRAPTLHRLSVMAFQPKLIEGKAIQLHPLACTPFNADFDGDQMAVHLPLSNEAVLEAQILMLQSHNVLNPANGAPITVPSQDMVLGLYYITKLRPGAKGEGLTFYGPEEAVIAYNEGRCDLHASVKVVVKDLIDGKIQKHLVETSVGRVIVNQIIPDEIGYFNGVISKKSLRGLIADVIKSVGMARACSFLDGIKNLGYRMSYLAGLSFNLDDIIVPPEKEDIVNKGQEEVDEITNNYDMGFITDNERYNQVIDTWTHVNNSLKTAVMKHMTEADQGFNAVYMMLDSGARGSADQIAQLAGMRGLMAKPQKAGAEGRGTIENPILSNFKEGMSVLEYFISSHGARKGLADTAMKTADAGYLTRRLVDVSHDVIITEDDCGTLRGLECTALKSGDEVISSLYERILGRVSVHDVVNPHTGELIVAAGEEIVEDKAKAIEDAGIEMVEIRSVLTCESKKRASAVSAMAVTSLPPAWCRLVRPSVSLPHRLLVSRVRSLPSVRSTPVVLPVVPVPTHVSFRSTTQRLSSMSSAPFRSSMMRTRSARWSSATLPKSVSATRRPISCSPRLTFLTVAHSTSRKAMRSRRTMSLQSGIRSTVLSSANMPVL